MSSTISQSLPRFMSIESVMQSNHLILCHPFLYFLQSFPSSGSFPRSQFFTSGGQIIWSFSFSISPSNEYSGLISFRIDCLDLLKVQGTLKSLLQHHNLKALILWCSGYFFIMHNYWKTIALTIQAFFGKCLYW